MKRSLKLFVWEDVLTDYTSGVMFTLAPDVETARKILQEASGFTSPGNSVEEDLKAEPLVVESPKGFLVWGGG